MMGAESRAKVAVCVARLQPPQQRHVDALCALAAQYDTVWLICGGVTQAASVLNPWSLDERCALLAAALPAQAMPTLLPVADCWYDDLRWAGAVRAALAAAGVVPGADIDVYGLERAGPDFYRACFPDWRACVLPAGLAPFDATLNERLLGATAQFVLDTAALPVCWSILAAMLDDELRRELRAEFAFIEQYRAAWHAAPFPPVFVTVDALVTHGDTVLVIRRGRRPGCGLLALPGGFIDLDEALCDSALRELREETSLVLPATACRAVRVFDHPLRSLRGRTITHLHRYELPCAQPAPTVLAGDDAAEAVWLPLSEARPQAFFEDHYAMLQVELGLP